MMDKKVLSVEGKELRTIQLEDSVFARAVSEGAIYHAVRNELANMRVGTASTKTRGEVIGGVQEQACGELLRGFFQARR